MQIAEFDDPYPRGEFERRLDGVPHLSLIAEEAGELLGFKVGYELGPRLFYSWMGGVLSAARGKGVATRLMNHQESWARSRGYREIRVKTRNRHRDMIRMLVKNDYLVAAVEQVDDLRQNRIHFFKTL